MKKPTVTIKLFPAACLLLFLCCFSACGKEKIAPGATLQEITVSYELEGAVKSVAVAEDGSTFVLFTYDTEELPSYRIYRFDEQGKCVDTYILDGYVNINSIVLKDDERTIYFAGQHDTTLFYLFALHTETGQIDEVCNFGVDIARTKKLVLIDGKMYIMGQKKQFSYETNSNIMDYNFILGETLLCCSMENGEYSTMDFEYPVNIASGGKGTLFILAYYPERGYCLMEYDPEDASLLYKAEYEKCRFRDFAVCNQGKSLLYDCPWSPSGLVMADIDEPDLEIDIYDDSTALASASGVWYEGGRIYLQEERTEKLVSFPLDAVQKENRTVRLVLTSELSYLLPYGCGYRLERLQEEWDKIALKLLVQDPDFDLCVGATNYGKSTAIRDSKAFYPLNDVPGIEEYFDRCFPYMREAATTEDGTIWMLPFSASIYAMFVQEERAAARGLDFHDNMTLEEFARLAGGLPEQAQEMFLLFQKQIGEELLRQYFWHNTTFPAEELAEVLEDLRTLYRSAALPDPPGKLNEDAVLCRIQRLGTTGNRPSEEFMLQKEGISVYSIPKWKSTDKTGVTLHYIVVNGKSEHLKETLHYLADLVAYLTSQEDLWIFRDAPAQNGTAEEQGRRLFANGEVSFAVDEDIYCWDYEEVLKSDQPLEQYVQELERRVKLYRAE